MRAVHLSYLPTNVSALVGVTESFPASPVGREDVLVRDSPNPEGLACSSDVSPAICPEGTLTR